MHRFTIILILLLLITTAKAQHIVVRDNKGTIVNNDTLVQTPEVTQKPPYTEISCYLYPQNSGTSAMNMGAKKTNIILAPDAEHAICFAGLCYNAAIFVSPNTSSVAPGQIDTGFSGHYRYDKTVHTPGKDLVAYTFYDADDPTDSAIVYVVYNTMSATGVPDAAVAAKLSLYPNPAAGHITATLGSSGSLTISDAHGRLIYHSPFAGKADIDISSWAAGSYIVTLTGANGEQSTKRFVKN